MLIKIISIRFMSLFLFFSPLTRFAAPDRSFLRMKHSQYFLSSTHLPLANIYKSSNSYFLGRGGRYSFCSENSSSCAFDSLKKL